MGTIVLKCLTFSNPFMPSERPKVRPKMSHFIGIALTYIKKVSCLRKYDIIIALQVTIVGSAGLDFNADTSISFLKRQLTMAPANLSPLMRPLVYIPPLLGFIINLLLFNL